MQLYKFFNGLLLTLTILFAQGCTAKKNNDKTDTKNEIMNSNVSFSSEKLESKGKQELEASNVVYFLFDRSDVSSEYMQILNQHADFLRNNPSVQIAIEGHADERGTAEYNIVLAERRANAVKMYLQGKGVNEEQIIVVSYGKEKPAALGHDEESYAKNRRAVLVY